MFNTTDQCESSIGTDRLKVRKFLSNIFVFPNENNTSLCFQVVSFPSNNDKASTPTFPYPNMVSSEVEYRNLRNPLFISKFRVRPFKY